MRQSGRRTNPVTHYVLRVTHALLRNSYCVLRNRLAVLTVSLFCAMVIGCDDMSDHARAKPLEASDFFADGKLARHPVQGTVRWAPTRGNAVSLS